MRKNERLRDYNKRLNNFLSENPTFYYSLECTLRKEQARGHLERRNENLKDICKKYAAPLSGIALGMGLGYFESPSFLPYIGAPLAMISGALMGVNILEDIARRGNIFGGVIYENKYYRQCKKIINNAHKAYQNYAKENNITVLDAKGTEQC